MQSGQRRQRCAAGARRVGAQESLDAARVGAEAAEVEPVAGRDGGGGISAAQRGRLGRHATV
jgi:hypothetical protein